MDHLWLGADVSGVLSLLASGGVLGTPQIADRSVLAGATFPSTATAEILFGSDGALTTYVNAVGTSRLPEWGGFSAGFSGQGDAYEIRLTVSSGSAPTSGPAADTWLAISSDRRWTLSRSSIGTSNASWLIQIRDKTSQTIRDSATYTMQAAVSSP
jgi:hypothetical protein